MANNQAKKAFSIAEEVVVDDSGRSRDGDEDDDMCSSIYSLSLPPLYTSRNEGSATLPRAPPLSLVIAGFGLLLGRAAVTG